MMTLNKLTIDKLHYERNQQVLLRDVNCTLLAGEALQIRGANGSGKTTLLRILAGYIEPLAGSVYWRDKCIFQQRDEYQQQLHYVGHLNGVKQNLTVKENLRLSQVLLGQDLNYSRIEKAMHRVGIQHLNDKQAINLSAGQVRRLALARLLLNPNGLWILDEPLTALDVKGQELFLSLLDEHLALGGMAVLATHHDLLLTNAIKTIHLGGLDE